MREAFVSEEIGKEVLRVWLQLVEGRAVNADFKLQEEVTIGGHVIPSGTQVKLWVKPRTKRIEKIMEGTPRTLGAFFLEDRQVSVMSDGRVVARNTPRLNKIRATLPLPAPPSDYGRRRPRPPA